MHDFMHDFNTELGNSLKTKTLVLVILVWCAE